MMSLEPRRSRNKTLSEAFVKMEHRRENKLFLPEENVQDKNTLHNSMLGRMSGFFFSLVQVKLAGVSVGERGHSSASKRGGRPGGLHTGMFWLAGHALLHCSLG